MLQNLTKGKMVEWVVLLVALVALGLSIAAVAKPCSSNFGDWNSQGQQGTRGGGEPCFPVGDCYTTACAYGDTSSMCINRCVGIGGSDEHGTCDDTLKGKHCPENCGHNIPHQKPINCKKLNPIECEKNIQCQINSDTGKCQMVNDNDMRGGKKGLIGGGGLPPLDNIGSGLVLPITQMVQVKLIVKK